MRQQLEGLNSRVRERLVLQERREGSEGVKVLRREGMRPCVLLETVGFDRRRNRCLNMEGGAGGLRLH